MLPCLSAQTQCNVAQRSTIISETINSEAVHIPSSTQPLLAQRGMMRATDVMVCGYGDVGQSRFVALRGSGVACSLPCVAHLHPGSAHTWFPGGSQLRAFVSGMVAFVSHWQRQHRDEPRALRWKHHRCRRRTVPLRGRAVPVELHCW